MDMMPILYICSSTFGRMGINGVAPPPPNATYLPFIPFKDFFTTPRFKNFFFEWRHTIYYTFYTIHKKRQKCSVAAMEI